MNNLSNNEPCPHCGRFAVRAVTVDAVIINDKQQILLVKRKNEPYKGLWSNAGGYLDWDETIEDAVKREAEEETGLTVTNVTFVKIYSNPKRHPNQAISVAYIVETTGEPKAGDDAAKTKWFDRNSLPAPLAFDHEHIINEVWDYYTTYGNSAVHAPAQEQAK